MIDPDMIEAKKILRQAIELIEKNGWCQKNPYDKEGRHCVAGAISVLCKNASEKVYLLCARLICDAIYGKSLYDGYENLTSINKWNDKSYRTREQVLEKMKQAAA